jgi:hypothetical protein
VDDTTTRDPRAGRARRPELPESLAWLSEPAPQPAPSPAPPAASAKTEPEPVEPADAQALPTLPPFSAPPTQEVRHEPERPQPRPEQWAPGARVSLFEPVRREVPAGLPSAPGPLPGHDELDQPGSDGDEPTAPGEGEQAPAEHAAGAEAVSVDEATAADDDEPPADLDELPVDHDEPPVGDDEAADHDEVADHEESVHDGEAVERDDAADHDDPPVDPVPPVGGGASADDARMDVSEPAGHVEQPATDLGEITPELDAQRQALPDESLAEPPEAPPHPPAASPLPDLADPALAPLWAAVRDALQAPAGTADALVDVRGLDRRSREAVAVLLDVRAVRSAARVDLARLDRVVREASGLPLADAAERYLPVPAPGRRARSQARVAPVRAAQDWLDAHPALAAQPWTSGWVETIRRDTLIGGTGLTEHEVVSALRILAAVPAPGVPAPGVPAPGVPAPAFAGTGEGKGAPGWRLRRELAAEAADDEHALDDGSAVSVLVLRGLAAAAGRALPGDAAARSRLWASFGVLSDLVSATCLAVGVAPADDALAQRWRGSAEAGLPVHVTARDLRQAPGPWVAVGNAWDAVLAVDGARTLEAVADRFGGRVACVCTDGVPGPVALDLLDRLHAAGTAVRFTADLDQRGLAVGTTLVERYGATPWCMTAEVYRAAARSDLPRFTGRVPEPAWQGDLGTALAEVGRALPVEQMLDELLDALAAELDETAPTV